MKVCILEIVMTIRRARAEGASLVFDGREDTAREAPPVAARGGSQQATAAGPRLSICYVVPGHDLVASAGPSRNVLNVAQQLARWADVTLAFRRVGREADRSSLRVIEIEPTREAMTIGNDDAALRGVGYVEFIGYLKTLARFAANELTQFDVVLEKSWLLSGLVSRMCARRGQAAIPIENYVPLSTQGTRRDALSRVRLGMARRIAGYCLRRAPLVVAETEHLKRSIGRFWRVDDQRIDVIGLGVDRSLFRPIDRQGARRDLGLETGSTILLYVGVLDRAHDLEPVIRAVGALPDSSTIRLHIVGDGALRSHYQQICAPWSDRVEFHGRLAHRDVPQYIGAADLCLAPYEPSWFPGEEVGYSTLKVREYLSSGRPVVSVPSGVLTELIQPGENGFLVRNVLEAWQEFLQDLPARESLAKLGDNAAATPLEGWDEVAQRYLTACREVIRRVEDRR